MNTTPVPDFIQPYFPSNAAVDESPGKSACLSRTKTDRQTVGLIGAALWPLARKFPVSRNLLQMRNWMTVCRCGDRIYAIARADFGRHDRCQNVPIRQ